MSRPGCERCQDVPQRVGEQCEICGETVQEQPAAVPSSRNLYAEMQSLCTQLRRLHLQQAKETSELAIEVDEDIFRGIQASVPADRAMSRFTDRSRWNEIEICGVIVRARVAGSRDIENLMLKRGMRKMWVAGDAR